MTEQDQNLRSERFGWPADWENRFKSALIVPGVNILHADSDNLFFIAALEYDEIERAYGRYNGSTESFVKGCSLYDNGFSLRLHTPTDGITFVSFEYDGYRVTFAKHHIGARTLKASYKSDGNLTEIEFIIIQPDTTIKGMVPFVRIFGDRKVDVLSNLDLNVSESEKDGVFILERLENGDIKDIIEVPKKVDVEGLRNKFIPDELLNNLKSFDTSLDDGWRGVDFFHEAGIRWDAVADDSFHSLTPIPPPAPEDQ